MLTKCALCSFKMARLERNDAIDFPNSSFADSMLWVGGRRG